MAAVIAGLFAATIALLIATGGRVFTGAAAQYRKRFTTQAGVSLADLFVFIEPQKIFLLHVISILSAFLLALLLTRHWVPALAVAGVIGVSPPFVYRHLKKRRIKKLVLQLPDALLSLAGSLKAGASMAQALDITVQEESAPIAQELDLFLKELRVGVAFDQALDNLASRMPAQDLQLVVAGMKISSEIGGNIAEVLDRLASTIRRKHEMEGKIDALTSQGKLQGIIMTALPVFLALVLYHMEPVHMSRLYTEWFGWVVIAVIVMLEAIGYFFIRKIVSIDV